MSKPKKVRTSDKYIDSLISELKSDHESSPGHHEKSSSGKNQYVDVAFEPVETPHSDHDSENHEEGDRQAPEGWLQDEKFSHSTPREESVTVPLHARENSTIESSGGPTDPYAFSEATQPMVKNPKIVNESSVKISYGNARSMSRGAASLPGQASEGQLAQAENLKFAQERILHLESEMEKIRQENELLASAGTIAKQRLDELTEKLHKTERQKMDALEQAELEMKILKESQMDKDRELIRARKKNEELESRLQSDMKKIRVRERELENRLELARLEKTALVRSKDESILELKRKMDQVLSDLQAYKQKASELQERIDQQQDQLGRTVRALRLALTNLESSDSTSGQLVPVKKAE